MKKIILASSSTDRSELFTRIGIPFEVVASDIDEDTLKMRISDPILLVKEIAKAKLLYVKNFLLKKSLQAIIIAADTIVELNGKIIGKAKNAREAFKIIKMLNGKTHNLITGIAITENDNPKTIVDHDTTSVEFLTLSDTEIEKYVNTNEWKGRAGAYSINDKASLFISKVDGSTSNVIGLPMHKIYEILKTDFELSLFNV
ncbi:MAG: septum formation protein Maf [Candidatus Lokiarchaeota archaeon]|nr:septum formation protein Maf [Candidatus Lokiarchaeota archaeon]